MKLLFNILILVLLASCDCDDDNDDNRSGLDCDKIQDSFLSDFAYAREVVDSICMTLPFMPTVDDPLGHEVNSNTLIAELNDECEDMTFVLDCFACLESLPPQSSFSVSLDSMNVIVIRYFRLRVPMNDFMSMGN